PGDGPHKTIYNGFIRWSRLGVFNRIFAELAARGGKPGRLMIDAPLKAHRTAASLLKRGLSRCNGRTKGGLNSMLHAVCDGQGRPVRQTLHGWQLPIAAHIPKASVGETFFARFTRWGSGGSRGT